MDAAAPAEPQQLDLSELQADCVPLPAAADAIDALIARLHINITDCVTAFASDISACTSTLADSRSVFTRTARVAQRRRSEWLDKQSEEIDAVEKLLGSFARLAECGEPWLVWDSVRCILPPLLSCDALPRLSGMIDVSRSGVDDVLLALWSGVSGGVSACEWRGSGVEHCLVGGGGVSRNVFEVCCVSECGDGVRGLTLGDVCVSVEGVGECVEVCGVTVDGSSGVITFSLRVDATDPRFDTLRVRISLFGSGAGEATVPVRRGIQGTFLGALDIPLKGSEFGIAVSADERVMALSDYSAKTVRLHSLPDGALIRSIGGRGNGPGQFNGPRKLCFGPNGNILVAENDNRRIQEVTVMGDHVRFVGVGVIQGLIQAVAASSTHIACVGIGSDDAKVRVFDYDSGALLHSFGTAGRELSQLSNCWGLRFTPDGRHIVLADMGHNRLARFTPTGEFDEQFTVACPTLHSPRDVVFTESGDMIVASYVISGGIHVLSLDGATFKITRSFSAVDTSCLTEEPKWADAAIALAYHSGRLYVLTGKGVMMFA